MGWGKRIRKQVKRSSKQVGKQIKRDINNVKKVPREIKRIDKQMKDKTGGKIGVADVVGAATGCPYAAVGTTLVTNT